MQVLGTQYALKKITDYVMAPPPQQGGEEPEEAPQQQAQTIGSLDGQVITDENGARLGVARHVANVAVYVVADRRTGLHAELRACLADETPSVFVQQTEEGTVTGLIYVPSPDRRPAPVTAQRADDI